MRCSKLCIGLLVVGIGGAVIFASMGNAKAASFLPFLPILACPLMCIGMMMFGKSCHGEECHDPNKKKPSTPSSPHADH